MTHLLLIRHAINDWVGDRLAGWTPGVHLNERGRDQAAALAERLAEWPIAAVYSSPLERTVETAEYLAARRQLPVTIVEGMGESQYGDWTGRSIKELAESPEWMKVQVTPSVARFPNGESLGEMQARAIAALEDIRQAHPKGVVAVFSHADVIKAVAAYYIGMHLDLFQRLVISPASITWLHFTPFGPRLLRLNDPGVLEAPKPDEKSGEPSSEHGATSAASQLGAEEPPSTPEPEYAPQGKSPE